MLSRVFSMKEPERFSGAKIPWHPALHLIAALCHDRRSPSPHPASAERLLNLTLHPLDDVRQLAFRALFLDRNEIVRWAAAHHAIELSIRSQPVIGEHGERDFSAHETARQNSLARAIVNLATQTPGPLPALPAAWSSDEIADEEGEEEYAGKRHDPDPAFDPQFAAQILPMFPIGDWYRSPAHRPHIEKGLLEFCRWTAERIAPPKHGRRSRRDRDLNLIDWSLPLGELLARAAPFHEASWVRENFLTPFLAIDEEPLAVLSVFADQTVTCHVLDAEFIPDNTFELLDTCADRLIADPTFVRQSHRAGEVYGHDLPRLISSLLFVTVEHAAGAARFVNGNWTQIDIIMPVVTKVVSAIGWSTFVIHEYLKLCDRVGKSFPIDDFAKQAGAALAQLAAGPNTWTGTTYPARIAGVVQRLTDANFPLREDQARALLQLLDALIDLGDRRSTALEQAEAFRSIQTPRS